MNKTRLNELCGVISDALSEIGQIAAAHPSIMVYDDKNEWAESFMAIHETASSRTDNYLKKFRKAAAKMPKATTRKKKS